MQLVAVKEKEKTKGCSAKKPTVIIVKVEKEKTWRKIPMKFGDIDDIICVAEYHVRELCQALPAEIREVLSKTESDMEVLNIKKRAHAGFGIVKEIPPILFTLEELDEKLMVLQGPELTEAKKKLKYLMDEKDFVLQKNKK